MSRVSRSNTVAANSGSSRFARPLIDVFGDEDTSALFSDVAMIEAWLEVERALVTAQVGLGLLPNEAAAAIVPYLSPEGLNLERLRDETRNVGYPILPLLQAISRTGPPEVGAYVHWGATTQDIMDTALVLQLRRALERIDSLLERLGQAIAELTKTHRSTIMAARTHGQQAVPTTFGAKTAVWLAEILRHRARLDQLRPRVLVAQLFGAGGTAAAFGERSRELRVAFGREVGLEAAELPWHTARDSVAELGWWLGAVTATNAKIAREVATLSRTEIGEVRESGGPYRGASSTMPQKANPILCEVVVGMSGVATQLVPALLVAMQGGNERATGEWQIEWDVVPQLVAFAAGSLACTAEIVGGLLVFPDRMRDNLSADGGMVMAEAAMMALAPALGRERAHTFVYEVCARVRQESRSFSDVLRESLSETLPEVVESVDSWIAPEQYLGEAEAMADVAVSKWQMQEGRRGRASPRRGDIHG